MNAIRGTKQEFRQYLQSPYLRIMRFQDWLELMRGVK